MAVELPRDAEGREVPPDTETLYGENGDGYEVYYYKYPVRRTAPGRGWQVVVTDYIVHDVSDLYLTPPDSWERLGEDLRAAEVCGDSPGPGDHVCAGCKLYAGDCAADMFKDIASRIHKPRGEAKWKPVLSPSAEMWRPDGPAAKAVAANAAGLEEPLAPIVRAVGHGAAAMSTGSAGRKGAGDDR